ncbi:MAG: gamma-glutamyltransferase [Geminicoccaceae bacterium]
MRDFQQPGRSAAYAAHGMAATSHPLSTLTAVDVLRAGGNAVDAAIAAHAVQCVVEPQSTGIGGDCWAIVATPDGAVHALNSSGWAPQSATVDRVTGSVLDEVGKDGVREAGIGPGSRIGQLSAHAVTVPGAPAGWHALLEAHGTRSLDELLQPAIDHAVNGFVVTPRVAFDWQRAESTLRNSEAGRRIYLPSDRVPVPGDVMALPLLGETFRRLGREGWRAFYEGELAARMVASLQRFGGFHQIGDFAEFVPEWTEPLRSSYRSVDILELPPNGHGITALELLNILETQDLAALDPLGADRYHFEAEATRLAFRDRDRHVADRRHVPVPVERLLDKDHARKLAASIDRGRAMSLLPDPGLDPHPDTVYLSVVDRDGTAISLINSVYDSFGSGLVCPDTGVVFHSRGRAFRLDEHHPNVIAPRKRPLHTIIPGMAMKDGRVWACFGVMGGDYQPVGHAHVITNMRDYGMDPQQAVSSPRAMAYPGPLKVERGLPERTMLDLAMKGHVIAMADSPLGGGQVIRIDHERGVLVGGSDPRKDGMALGY